MLKSCWVSHFGGFEVPLGVPLNDLCSFLSKESHLAAAAHKEYTRYRSKCIQQTFCSSRWCVTSYLCIGSVQCLGQYRRSSEISTAPTATVKSGQNSWRTTSAGDPLLFKATISWANAAKGTGVANRDLSYRHTRWNNSSPCQHLGRMALRLCTPT